jgi:hypothetical protein
MNVIHHYAHQRFWSIIVSEVGVWRALGDALW